MTVSRYSVCTLTLVLLLVQLLLVVPSTEASCACKNGGKAYLPSNIFGTCRCLCSSGFKGPKCQFVRKRDGGMMRLSELLGSRKAGNYGGGYTKRGGSELGDEEMDTEMAGLESDRGEALLSLLRRYDENMEEDLSALDM